MTDNYIKETEHYALYILKATKTVPVHYGIFNKRYGVVEWEGAILFMGLATIDELENKLMEALLIDQEQALGDEKQTSLLPPIEGEANYNY